ncbi:hypothetical protein AAFF_G00437980, partial [Aldrovandia affinis]
VEVGVGVEAGVVAEVFDGVGVAVIVKIEVVVVGGRRHTVASNEIRATVFDHVVNQGLTRREAGRIVQANLKRTERRQASGGRGGILGREVEGV